MQSPLHKTSIAVIAGAVLAQTITGQLGVILGYIFGLTIAIYTLKRSNPLETDAERILRGNSSFEKLAPLIVMALFGSLLFGIAVFNIIATVPMAEAISTASAILALIGGMIYLFMNG